MPGETDFAIRGLNAWGTTVRGDQGLAASYPSLLIVVSGGLSLVTALAFILLAALRAGLHRARIALTLSFLVAIAFVLLNLTVTGLVVGAGYFVPKLEKASAFAQFSASALAPFCYGLIFIVPTVVAIVYSASRWLHRSDRDAGGEHSRRIVYVGFIVWGVVTIVAVAVSGLATLYALAVPGERLFPTLLPDRNYFQAFAWVVALFGLAATTVLSGLAVVLDAFGDLVFYLNPRPGTPAYIQAECRMRLRAVLELEEVREADRVVIVAHSLGSLIAHDVLRWCGLFEKERQVVDLYTVGSPLGTLTGRFLDREVAPLRERDVDRWFNLYRAGDFVAGPIKEPGVWNADLGAGGHTGYWALARLGRAIRFPEELEDAQLWRCETSSGSHVPQYLTCADIEAAAVAQVAAMMV